MPCSPHRPIPIPAADQDKSIPTPHESSPTTGDSGKRTSSARPGPPANAQGRGETILVADDEGIIIEMARSLLERAGYTVLTAMNGEEALAVFEARQDTIHLVILDVVMPKLSGQEASEKMRALRGDVPILFTSGYSVNTLDLLSSEESHTRFLQKPYHLRELLATVRELLDVSPPD